LRRGSRAPAKQAWEADRGEQECQHKRQSANWYHDHTDMRNTFLDCTRGLGICLVVFGHVQRGLSDAHLLPANYPFERIDFTLYTFHMPLFFLLAGLYVWPALDKGRIPFIRSKFMAIVVPYFVWSIIQGGV
jgi:fucose 4-O-acetylase-like acetyltransferase